MVRPEKWIDMAIHDIYSKRQKRLRGEVPDVYSYLTINSALKNQIILIMGDATGKVSSSGLAKRVYSNTIEILSREWGEMDLIQESKNHYADDILFYRLSLEANIDRCLDIIEVVFSVTSHEISDWNIQYIAEHQNCINELNARFKEHGLGYELINNEIIRIDTQIIHAEAVKPAIGLLNQASFEGAQDEFLSAYHHYRNGHHKEAITEANKSLESTMKVICDQKGWNYKKSDTAKKLIVICMDNGLFPSHYQSHLSALANLLEGVTTIRNNDGGHGQGAEIKVIDAHIVSYVLHMTASAVVLLAKSAAS